MGKSRSIASTILVIVLAFSNVLTYVNLKNQITILKNEKNSLENQLNKLQTNYDKLNISYHALNISFFELQNHYFKLHSQYEELNRRYVALQINYRNLESDFNSLTQSYIKLQRCLEIEKSLHIGNSLELYYDYLRRELGSTGITERWLTESYYQAEVNFAANLALHDLGLIYWPSIEKDYYENIGEYSYIMAKKKIDQIILLIGIDVYDTPTEKIRKILDFLHRYIHYEPDFNDVYLAPVETLGFKSGDCDDFSILAAALFEAVGIDAAIGLFRNENGEYHMMVLVHLEDLAGYDYYSFSDLTGRGLEKGRWIIIEPQTTIDNQGTDWIKQWELVAAAPLDAD